MKALLVATVQSHICQFHRPLAELLRAYGWQVDVAARDNLAEKNGLKLDFAAQVFDVPFDRSPFSARNLKAYRQLRQIIEDGGYDVVHCNTPVGGVAARLAARSARKRGTRVFYTAHGFHFYQGAPKKNWLVYYPVERLLCRWTDCLLTITREDYELASRRFPVHAVRTHGVGANSAKYARLSDERRAQLRQELGYDADARLILCTGELLANKNQRTIIAAMPQIVERVPQAQLLLAGNGPLLEELQQQVETLGLQNRVQFLGYRTDLERYANVADVIVSCSFREGLPMNIVEGMLVEKPVVASRNRGHRELVDDGVTGFLVSPRDVDAFARHVIRLMDDDALARAMGRAGMEKAQAYTDRAAQRELAQVYGLAPQEDA